VKVPADRSARQIQHLADFRAGPAVDVRELDDETLMLRERRERRSKARANLRALGWIEVGGDVVVGPQMEFRHMPFSRRSRTNGVERAIHDDLEEPRREWSRRVERVEGVERGNERVLHEILRVLRLPEDPVGDGERPSRITLGQLVERLVVAALNTTDEPLLIVRRL